MRILKDLGARIVFFGEVMEQTAGAPIYDRIAVVLYPTRMKFLEMQRRPDFVDSHEHKDAGMEFTIVASTSPITEPHEQTTGTLALVVEETHNGAAFDPSSIEGLYYAYLQGNGGLRTNREESFDTNGVKFAVTGEFGVAAIDYRGWFKNAGV